MGTGICSAAHKLIVSNAVNDMVVKQSSCDVRHWRNNDVVNCSSYINTRVNCIMYIRANWAVSMYEAVLQEHDQVHSMSQGRNLATAAAATTTTTTMISAIIVYTHCIV